jgi:AraC-like DNA-binding protein
MEALFATLKLDRLDPRVLPAILSYLSSAHMTIKMACAMAEITKEEFYTEFHLISSDSPGRVKNLLTVSNIDAHKIANVYLLSVELASVAVRQNDINEHIQLRTRKMLEDFPYLKVVECPKIYSVEATNVQGETQRMQVARTNEQGSLNNPMQMQAWPGLEFSNGVSLSLTTPEFGFDYSSAEETLPSILMHQTSSRYGDEPDPQERIVTSVRVFVPVIALDDPDALSMSKIEKLLINRYKHPHRREGGPMSIQEEVTLEAIAQELVSTDKPIPDILSEQQVASRPKFYLDFRRKYNCTPGEYREQERALQREAATQEDQPFDFTVTLRQVSSSPIDMTLEQSNLNQSLQLPLIVNGQYEFRAQVVTTSGQPPTADPREFLRSEYREKFNALVVDTLLPYFHGRLDIAYMQTLQPQRPYGAWPHGEPRFTMERFQ